MKFCSHCGQEVQHKIPEGDNRLRYLCTSCDFVHYQNPNIVAGTITTFGDKVLLCKRAIEPRYGYWTLPAGFMENQETTEEAAVRETWEEAEAQVRLGQFFSMISVPQIDQVHIFFLAELIEPKFAAGSESLEVALFDEERIPWDEIAFPTVKKTLKLFFEDRKNAHFGTHINDIIRHPREKIPTEHN